MRNRMMLQNMFLDRVVDKLMENLSVQGIFTKLDIFLGNGFVKLDFSYEHTEQHIEFWKNSLIRKILLYFIHNFVTELFRSTILFRMLL